jgi:hypothetical protein
MDNKLLRIVSLLTGMLIVMGILSVNMKMRKGDLSQKTGAESSVASTAHLESEAVTIEELVQASDRVIRARVVKAPVTRVVRMELPVSDENGKAVDTTIIQVLFSDTVFQVLETYVGEPSKIITVTQSGGFNPAVSKGVEEQANDPLYEVGEEYVLFLIDISADQIGAPDRELYRVINPFGRYGVNGKSVFSYGQNLKTFESPTKFNDLEAQIENAIIGQNK